MYLLGWADHWVRNDADTSLKYCDRDRSRIWVPAAAPFAICQKCPTIHLTKSRAQPSMQVHTCIVPYFFFKSSAFTSVSLMLGSALHTKLDVFCSISGMIGVPAKIKSPDLLQFTAPCHSELEMMRIIQDSSPNQYMTLLRFRCQVRSSRLY